MFTRTIGDAELVKQTQDGLISGYESLVRRYYARCMRLASGMLNREEAQEAVQDAFIKVYSHIDTFRGDAKFSTWLYRILYNLCYTRLKYKKRFVDISHVEDRYESRLLNETVVESSFRTLEEEDMAEHVVKILEELPERYKTVMHLFYVEDMTIEEIAHIMNINGNSVKVRLYRGRMLLRDMVINRLGEDIPS